MAEKPPPEQIDRGYLHGVVLELGRPEHAEQRRGREAHGRAAQGRLAHESDHVGGGEMMPVAHLLRHRHEGTLSHHALESRRQMELHTHAANPSRRLLMPSHAEVEESALTLKISKRTKATPSLRRDSPSITPARLSDALVSCRMAITATPRLSGDFRLPLSRWGGRLLL
jgi:hypothetical protein